ncbi:hypothetical protein HN385_05420 [archaeon]|jgi:uncharacterized protein|nr:hypothetical protein [archaeon]MBT3450954.1 hypothetical protein [archaeon]MBT6869477.1 hypothetical protein [archaeon]MBT7193165.1 hypothetical protein [archaeon]MBT7380471.1 hypothetical protein [archaeon]
MKFLTFADLHGDTGLLKKLVKRAKQDDIQFVLIAGDFTSFEANMRAILKRLNSINKPVYLIPGNHEESKNYRETVKDYSNCEDVNKKALIIGDFIILSYGGGGFAASDSDFREIARKWYGKYKGKKIIFMTHGPPYKTKLDLINDRYVGNKDYRKFIERMKPKLVIAGHIHENFGVVDEIDGTKLVNPGYEGMVIELF